MGEFLPADEAGGDGDRANSVGSRGANIVGVVADQRHRRAVANPALPACVAEGDAHEAGSIARQFGEGSEAEVAAETGALHFPPSNAGEIAR